MNNKMCYMGLVVSCLLTIGLVFFNSSIFSVAAESDEKPAAESDENPVSFNSIIEVEGYYIEEGHLNPGEEASIVLTIRNTNRYNAVNGLLISVSSDSKMIYPTYGNDDQFFVGTLDANDTTTITIPIIVDSGFTGDYADLTCKMIYEISGKQLTNTSSMFLPSSSNETITVNSIDVSAHATVNGKSLLSINYGNKSSGNISDAVLLVNGNVSETTNTIELGQVEAGKTYTKDFNVIFTEAGEQSISILLRYTDLDGTVIESELGAYNIKVSEDNSDGAVFYVENTSLKWFGRTIAIVSLVIALCYGFVYIKKK